jgi:hypothetical protein
VRNAAIFLTAIFACVFYSFIREPVYETRTDYYYNWRYRSVVNQDNPKNRIERKDSTIEIKNENEDKKDKYLSLFFTALILFPSYLGIKNLLLYLKEDKT